MYGDFLGVDALLPGAHLGDLSTPDEPNIMQWLKEGAAEIDVALSAAGYVVPVSPGGIVFTRLTALNNLYAAAYTLRARGLDVLVGETEMRSDIWLREFRDGLAALVASDLTGVGVSLRQTSSSPRHGIRTTQMRRVDGYSGAHNRQGEYTGGYGVTE